MRKKAEPKPIPGNWAVMDEHGNFLNMSLKRATPAYFISTERVFAWKGLEEATLFTHSQAVENVAQFPVGCTRPVEVIRVLR